MRSPVLALARRAGIAAALSLALAGASAPGFAPDAAARAPRLEGFGRSDVALTTSSPQARQLFNRGLLQAYAFDEVEAVRTFKAALAADPACAMCSWGVAWQLGPTINDTSRGHVPEALRYVDWALRHLRGATPRERALVESLALRYAHGSQARETAPLTAARCGGAAADQEQHPLDLAYADRMRRLADRYPDDPDVLSLYAEAEIIATPGPAPWTRSGQPAGRMGEVTQRLERLVRAQPEHTGINHYLVHATDVVGVAARAAEAADRLGRLAPASPHLLHMPAHTYSHLGRYIEAVRVNQAAVAADPALAQHQKEQGFAPSKDWRGHNLHFLWYAAVMSGQEAVATEAATAMAQRVGPSHDAFTGYVHGLLPLTLVRFEHWSAVLQAPRVAADAGVEGMWDAWARGVANARLGRLQDARAAQDQLARAAADLRQKNAAGTDARTHAPAMADYAQARLQAEIAAAQGDFGTAIAQQRKALEAATPLDAREPPMLAGEARLVLGQFQARAGNWPDAEATFRLALADDPGSGWALRGLGRSLAAQGRTAEAAATREQLDRAWQLAAPQLRDGGA
ncbi:MAG: hypothetical protein ACXWC6_13100 [Ramlibacter sp.]